MKDKDSSSLPVNSKINWRSFDLAMTENLTSDDLHDHKNECFIDYDE